MVRGALRLGFEVKRTTAPGLTSSMRSALHDLNLRHLYVIHAGAQSFPLARNVTAVAFRRMLTDAPLLR